MRHKKKLNHLSRKKGHREAMMSNMASSLILHKRITTTTAKAKALRVFVEPLITKAKEDTTHSRRQAFSSLQDKEATAELFREVAVKVGDRPGGYTRIIKLGNRVGDNADMCIIELVDYNENLLAEKEASKKSSRRRRGGKKKVETPAAEAKQEAPAAESTEELAQPEKVEEDVVDESTAQSDDTEEVDVEEKKVDAASDTAEQEESNAPVDEAGNEETADKTEEEKPAPEAKADQENEETKDQPEDSEGEEKKKE